MVSRSKILCGISRATIKFVIPTYVVMSIKNARFTSQPSTQMLAFASMRSTPFMEIDDKGGEIGQRYESFFELRGEIRKIGHGQRGSNIEECKGIKHSWTKKAHK
jgi:hypothetical protein